MPLNHFTTPSPPAEINCAAALSGFFKVMAVWGASQHDARAIPGAPPERTYYNWKAGQVVRVPMDTMRRIGYVAGIYMDLEKIYSDRSLAHGWIKHANRAFGDQTPLQRMRAGDVTDLAAVRSYLASAQALWN